MLVKKDIERTNTLDEWGFEHGALFKVNDSKRIDIDFGALDRVSSVWLIKDGDIINHFDFHNHLFYLEDITDQNGDLDVDVLCNYIAREEALA